MAPQPERQAVQVADTSNSFKSKTTLTAGGKTYAYFSLPAAEKDGLADISRLPHSLKVLLENLLRFEDGQHGHRRRHQGRRRLAARHAHGRARNRRSARRAS